ncbi:MAG: pyrimidine 5'-nucleotidase [Pseudomonadota bacterium]
MAKPFSNREKPIETWVFDLDNTLYHPSARLFDQIEERMRTFIARELALSLHEADRLRSTYWAKYGTTLAGLMAEHSIKPMKFLEEVHDIDLSDLDEDARLSAQIDGLPGRKIVFTNGDADYAQRVLAAIGLTNSFDALYGIEHADFIPKPAAQAFDTVFAIEAMDTATAVMFEDTARNLEVPHARGMGTVLVHASTENQAHIHHDTYDLAGFLSQLTDAPLP